MTSQTCWSKGFLGGRFSLRPDICPPPPPAPRAEFLLLSPPLLFVSFSPLVVDGRWGVRVVPGRDLVGGFENGLRGVVSDWTRPFADLAFLFWGGEFDADVAEGFWGCV